jgi:hypothetical protein
MRRSRFVGLAVLVTAALAVFAATASPAAAGAAAPSAAQSNGVMHVGFAVQKFVKQGKTLVAVGQTIATVTTDQGTYTSTQPFISKVTRKAAAHVSSVRTTQQASRICNVLNLTLGPLHLAVLGLIIDLDKVVLNITADSNGGLLGGLLCGLAGGGGILGTATNAAKRLARPESFGASTVRDMPAYCTRRCRREPFVGGFRPLVRGFTLAALWRRTLPGPWLESVGDRAERGGSAQPRRLCDRHGAVCHAAGARAAWFAAR